MRDSDAAVVEGKSHHTEPELSAGSCRDAQGKMAQTYFAFCKGTG